MPYTFEDIKKMKTNCDFVDISDEMWRQYVYHIDGEWVIQRYLEPIALEVRSSGAHLLILQSGKAAYVKAGWISLEWDNKPGKTRANF